MHTAFRFVFAVLVVPMAWSNGIYNFTQVSPSGQAINTNSGAAIDSSGLVAWTYGNTIQTWNGSTVSTYTPGVTPANVGSNIGLSDAGVVSFTSFDASGTHGQVYSIPGGTLTSFDYPGQTDTYAGGSSTNGVVAGNYAGNAGFVWSGGVFTDINYPGTHGQVYTTGVNAAGDVVGFNYCCTLGVSFLDKGGVFTTISVSGVADNNVLAHNVNNSDVVVGWVDINNIENGFVWQNGVGSIVNYPGATNTIIYGVNSAGVLVGEADFGTYTNGIVFTATLSSQTPEPGTLGLLLGAGALLGTLRKYRAS